MTRPTATFRTHVIPEATDLFEGAVRDIPRSATQIAEPVTRFQSATMMRLFDYDTVFFELDGEAPFLLARLGGVVYTLRLPEGTQDDPSAVEDALLRMNTCLTGTTA